MKKTTLCLTFLGLFFLISCSSFGDKTKEQKIKPTGSHLIGGSFKMTNHQNKEVSERDFFGQYTLIFFGFTSCKTVCPLGLSTIGRTLNKLPKDVSNKIQPIFVTIDPDRDTSKVMSKYIKIFNKRFVGLRGSITQTDNMVKNYRAYYSKLESDNKAEYEMEHSDVIYLMDKKGQYLAHFSSSSPIDSIAKRIEFLIK